MVVFHGGLTNKNGDLMGFYQQTHTYFSWENPL